MNKNLILINILFPVIVIFIFWAGFSFFASAIKASESNCDKQYPIGYLLATNLFCEITPEDKP